MSFEAQLGFALEIKIHEKLVNICSAYRENEIKKLFGDQSLNGVDHLAIKGDRYIFIQDKWKQSVCQQEVSQFLDCAMRIVEKLKLIDYHLIFVTKTTPTKFALKSLEEKSVHVIISNDHDKLVNLCYNEVDRILGFVKCDIKLVEKLEDLKRLGDAVLIENIKLCLDTKKRTFDIELFNKLKVIPVNKK